MSRTAAPVLGIAAATLFRDSVIGDKKWVEELKVVAAAGIALVLFTGFEKVNSRAAVGMAYLALLTAVVVPLGGKPSFAESVTSWYGQQAGKA